MRKTKNRPTARLICLMLAVLMTLSACGTAGGTETEEASTVPSMEYSGLYQPHFLDWPPGYTMMLSAQVYGSSAYAVIRHDTDGILLTRVSLPDGEAVTLACAQNQISGNISVFSMINGICAVKGGVWYRLYTGTQDTGDPLNTKSESLTELIHVGNSGEELARIDITDALEGSGPDSFCADDAGNMAVITGDGRLFAFGADGNKLFSADISGNCRLVRGADGSVYLYRANRAAPFDKALIPVDFTAERLGEAIDITSLDPRWISEGCGNDDFYYESGDGVFALSLEGMESRPVLDYFRHGIKARTVDAVSRDEKGDFLALETSRSAADVKYSPLYLQAVENIDYDPGDPDTFPPIMREKTVLTYRTPGASMYMRNLISDFNQSNHEYAVEIVDYSELTNGNLIAIRDLMLLDVAAGKPTDLIDLNFLHMPRESWGNLVLDLYPFLDADPEYGRDAFVPSVLAALDYNGTLPRLAREFKIDTLVGKQSIFGDELGWSFEDMQALEATLPEGTYLLGDVPQIVLFNMLFFMGSNRFISEDGKACSFDSDEFISMLEWCADLPENPKYTSNPNIEFEDFQQLILMLDEDLRSDSILLTRCEISSPRVVRMFKEVFGEEVCFIGYPGSQYGAGFDTGQTFSISAISKNPQGAWEFIRSALSRDSEINTGLSVIAAKLEAQLEAEMMPPVAQRGGFNYYQGLMRSVGGASASSTSWVNAGGNADLSRYALTREEMQQFMDVINAVPAWQHIDSAVYGIVMETVRPFFEGDKTAPEAAEIIQNRVSTLLAERS